MPSISEKAGDFWRSISGLLSTRRDSAPIDSVAKLTDFVGTRSSYVAQKTLYGYVKTRMGIRYPAMFEDKLIIASLNIAKLQVFAACLSDLTIYAVATSLHDQPAVNAERQALALHCFDIALRDNTGSEPEQFSPQKSVEEFRRRVVDTEWRSGARRAENFTLSPQALVQWAPIADNLKKFDTEIVENSVKFAWRDIRERFEKRIVPAAIHAEWLQQTAD